MSTFVNYTTLIRDFAIDFISLYFFSYRILYRRYLNKELFVTCSLFNIFLLLVVMALVRTDFNMAMGFGLFALLSLVTLRSATFSKAEMAYVFGSVALAVINGAGITDLVFVLICNGVIIVSSLVISGWSIENSANVMGTESVGRLRVTLDRIDPDALNNHHQMKMKLRRNFNINIIGFKMLRVDYVKDLMLLEIAYQLDGNGNPVPIEQEPPAVHASANLTALPVAEAAR
jgi:Domain of unknown function (DUF4956)